MDFKTLRDELSAGDMLSIQCMGNWMTASVVSISNDALVARLGARYSCRLVTVRDLRNIKLWRKPKESAFPSTEQQSLGF